jgi:hypothetical protein
MGEPEMFTNRHEQELAEIKALTAELSRRFDAIQGQLKRIEEAQHGASGTHKKGPKTAASQRKKGHRSEESAKSATAELVGAGRKRKADRGERKGKQRRRAAESPSEGNQGVDRVEAELASSTGSSER